MQRITVTLLFLVAVQQWNGGGTDAFNVYDYVCDAQLGACLMQYGWYPTRPISFFSLLNDYLTNQCPSGLVQEEMDGVWCLVGVLQTATCSSSPTYGWMSDGVGALSITKETAEQGLMDVCYNSDVLRRIPICVGRWYDHAADQRCSVNFHLEFDMYGPGDETCHAANNFLKCYVDENVAPLCDEADLRVLFIAISKLAPPGCVLSTAHHVTGTAAAILAALVLALWFTQK